jgi:hypothetical protein
MASGPTGTGWSDLAKVLNGIFADTIQLQRFAIDFKQKHGPDGRGRDQGTTPYKFGQFVDRRGGLLRDTALGQFLIDSGRRHWDGPSLDLLEHTVRHSLTQAIPRQIHFEIHPVATATVARAEIRDHAGRVLNTATAVTNAPTQPGQPTYKVDIFCPPSNPRPNP